MPYKPKTHKPHQKKTYDKAYDKNRDRSPERQFIHSTRWRKIREMKLTHNPLCEICLESNIERIAIIVHHRDGDELNNSMDNYQSVCSACHNRLHGIKHERS